MSVSVSMPQLGESVTEGTVTRWLKKEGERVEVDEPLLEVSTDKVDTEIPSPASGILRGIAVDEDETVAVGAQLAVIDDGESGDAAPAADDSASAAPAEAAEPAQPQAAQPQRQPSLSLAPTKPGGAGWRVRARSSDGAGSGRLGWLELAGLAAQLRAARAVLPRGLAGIFGPVRALDACLRAAARLRPVVPALRRGGSLRPGPSRRRGADG